MQRIEIYLGNPFRDLRTPNDIMPLLLHIHRKCGLSEAEENFEYQKAGGVCDWSIDVNDDDASILRNAFNRIPGMCAKTVPYPASYSEE